MLPPFNDFVNNMVHETYPVFCVRMRSHLCAARFTWSNRKLRRLMFWFSS